MSSYKIDWILFELPLLALSCLLYNMVSNTMNTQGECICLRKVSINVNKLPAVLLSVYPLFINCILLLLVYFFIPFFILMLLLYFCLFVDYVYNPTFLFFKLLFIILITPFPFSEEYFYYSLYNISILLFIIIFPFSKVWIACQDIKELIYGTKRLKLLQINQWKKRWKQNTNYVNKTNKEILA